MAWHRRVRHHHHKRQKWSSQSSRRERHQRHGGGHADEHHERDGHCPSESSEHQHHQPSHPYSLLESNGIAQMLLQAGVPIEEIQQAVGKIKQSSPWQQPHQNHQHHRSHQGAPSGEYPAQNGGDDSVVHQTSLQQPHQNHQHHGSHRGSSSSKYPLLNGGDTYVVHQTNTSGGTNPVGKFLSEGVFRKWPIANCYRNKSNTTHKPGDIQVVPVGGGQHVVNIFGQKHRKCGSESRQQQEQWFKMALGKLAQEIKGPCTIGFPDKGRNYNNMIKEFAKNVRDKRAKVNVYPYDRSRGGRAQTY